MFISFQDTRAETKVDDDDMGLTRVQCNRCPVNGYIKVYSNIECSNITKVCSVTPLTKRFNDMQVKFAYENIHAMIEESNS